MIKNNIKEPTTEPRISMPEVAQRSMKTSSIHVAMQHRCNGCGQVMVDDKCPECGKVVTL